MTTIISKYSYDQRRRERIKKNVESRQKEAQKKAHQLGTGTKGGEATCCSITSLDELANIANQGGNLAPVPGHEVIHNPFSHSAAEAAITPLVSAFAAAGVYIGYQIDRAFAAKSHELEKDLVGVWQKMAALPSDQDAAQHAKSIAYRAYERTMLEQLTEVDFQSLWAGKVSAIGSGAIFVGQFVPALGTAALFTLGAVGAAHTAHMLRMRRQTSHKVERAERAKSIALPLESIEDRKMRIMDAEIRQRYFTKKRKHLTRNALSWSMFTAGADALAVAQLGAWSVATTFPPALSIAGISALGAGVLTSVVQNNILTSSRYITSMPKHAMNSLENENGEPISHQAVQRRNIASDAQRKIIKDYRAAFFSARSTSDKIKHGLLRFRQKLLAYSTLGIVEYFTKAMKYGDKITVSGQSVAGTEEKRLDILNQLGAKEVEILGNKQTSSGVENAETESNLGQLIQAIFNSGHHDGVCKILAGRLLAETKHKVEVQVPKLNWRRKPITDADGKALTKNKKISAPQFKFQSEKYGDMFESDYVQELTEYAEIIHTSPPCCSSDYFSREILEHIQRAYCVQESAARATDFAEKKLRMTNLIQEVTDHYLLFQARKNAKERIAIWSGLSDSFQKVQEKDLEEKKAKELSPLTTSGTSKIISQAAAQKLAKNLYIKGSPPKGYKSFNEVMRHTMEDGRVHIVFQDPYKSGKEHQIHYLVSKDGSVTVRLASTSKVTALIPVQKRESENKPGGIVLHGVHKGKHEGLVASYGKVDSIKVTFEQTKKDKKITAKFTDRYIADKAKFHTR